MVDFLTHSHVSAVHKHMIGTSLLKQLNNAKVEADHHSTVRAMTAEEYTLMKHIEETQQHTNRYSLLLTGWCEGRLGSLSVLCNGYNSPDALTYDGPDMVEMCRILLDSGLIDTLYQCFNPLIKTKYRMLLSAKRTQV